MFGRQPFCSSDFGEGVGTQVAVVRLGGGNASSPKKAGKERRENPGKILENSGLARRRPTTNPCLPGKSWKTPGKFVSYRSNRR